MKIAVHPKIFVKLNEKKRKLPKLRKLCKQAVEGSGYDFAIDWHYSKTSFTCHKAWLEKGFFYGSCYIDFNGLFNEASFTIKENNKYWREYEAKETASSIVKKLPIVNLGAHRAKVDKTWKGVVLPLQRFYDKILLVVGTNDRYRKFIKDACKYYKENLFLKVHPLWQHTKFRALWDEVYELAEHYGCSIGNVTHKVFDECDFVLTYSGMTAIDCLLRGIPVVQYAPGPFDATEAIEFTNWKFVSKYSGDIKLGYKLCDFLMWKYYFAQDLSDSDLCELVTCFAEAEEPFPLPEKFSFANNWHLAGEEKK